MEEDIKKLKNGIRNLIGFINKIFLNENNHFMIKL